MNSNHKKFFLVVEDGHAKYIKLDSEYIIGKQEGIDILRESHPNATEIKALTIKAAKFLNLN